MDTTNSDSNGGSSAPDTTSSNSNGASSAPDTTSSNSNGGQHSATVKTSSKVIDANGELILVYAALYHNAFSNYTALGKLITVLPDSPEKALLALKYTEQATAMIESRNNLKTRLEATAAANAEFNKHLTEACATFARNMEDCMPPPDVTDSTLDQIMAMKVRKPQKDQNDTPLIDAFAGASAAKPSDPMSNDFPAPSTATAKPSDPMSNDDAKKNVELVREIMLWIHNMLWANKITAFTDEDILKHLILTAKSAGLKLDYTNHDLGYLLSSIPYPVLLESVREFPTEPLKTELKTKLPYAQPIKFVGCGTETLAVFLKDDLLSSDLYRRHLFQGECRDGEDKVLSDATRRKESYTEKIEFSVPVNLVNKGNVISALQRLCSGDCNNYYDHLTTLEEVAEFIRVFQYLELGYVE